MQLQQYVGIDEAECMGLAMDELAPFGDIPKRSIVHLERTLQVGFFVGTHFWGKGYGN